MDWLLEEVEKYGKEKKIALQFPDQMLSQSKTYLVELQRRFPTNEFFILADTSYNNCCVDEVAADHVEADLVIHFGDSCLSPPSKTRTLWFFEQENFPEQLEIELNSLSQNTLLFYHIKYHNYFTNLSLKNSKISIGRTILDSSKLSSSFSLYNRSFDQEIPNEYQVIWIGPSDSFTLLHILLCEQSKSTQLLKWNFTLNQFDSNFDDSRLFQRRIHFLNQIKKFSTFVLLLSSISNSRIVEMISKIQELLDRHSKVYYSVIVGKLNPSKLANFLEIDCFVWLGCSESSIIYDMKLYREYHKPIVTPIELMLGLREDPFATPYVLDFDKILNGDFVVEGEEDGNECSEETSLITAAMDRSLVMIERTNERKFKGLRYEIDSDEEENLVIGQGKCGIAKGYQNEKQILN